MEHPRTPLLSDPIEADTDIEEGRGRGQSGTTANAAARSLGSAPSGNTGSGNAMGSIEGGRAGNGGGVVELFRQSSHPVALLFLYLFQILAIAVYLFCGFFFDNYIFSTVIVVLLLSFDFWTCRNVSGRVLVGLRFWNQVDEDGSSYWVFESRDPSIPSNAVDSRLFWTKIYVTPVIWGLLLIVSLLKLSLNFLPIIALALTFSVTNLIGFSYADRDARKKWAQGFAGGSIIGQLGSLGGVGAQMAGGLARSAFSRLGG